MNINDTVAKYRANLYKGQETFREQRDQGCETLGTIVHGSYSTPKNKRKKEKKDLYLSILGFKVKSPLMDCGS